MGSFFYGRINECDWRIQMLKNWRQIEISTLCVLIEIN